MVSFCSLAFFKPFHVQLNENALTKTSKKKRSKKTRKHDYIGIPSSILHEYFASLFGHDCPSLKLSLPDEHCSFRTRKESCLPSLLHTARHFCTPSSKFLLQNSSPHCRENCTQWIPMTLISSSSLFTSGGITGILKVYVCFLYFIMMLISM
jgi:hypothetical protein